VSFACIGSGSIKVPWRTLLQTDFAVAEKDRLYRCLDRLLQHKADLFQRLRECWQDLFQAQFDVLLYDLTSTYIEGEGAEIPKAKYGYSRDLGSDLRAWHRSWTDCDRLRGNNAAI
jgi:hypothetical protein